MHRLPREVLEHVFSFIVHENPYRSRLKVSLVSRTFRDAAYRACAHAATLRRPSIKKSVLLPAIENEFFSRLNEYVSELRAPLVKASCKFSGTGDERELLFDSGDIIRVTSMIGLKTSAKAGDVCVAERPHQSSSPRDLSFEMGDRIEIIDAPEGKRWWKGTLHGKVGMFLIHKVKLAVGGELWWKGTHVSRGLSGLFPSSLVEPASGTVHNLRRNVLEEHFLGVPISSGWRFGYWQPDDLPTLARWRPFAREVRVRPNSILRKDILYMGLSGLFLPIRRAVLLGYQQRKALFGELVSVDCSGNLCDDGERVELLRCENRSYGGKYFFEHWHWFVGANLRSLPSSAVLPVYELFVELGNITSRQHIYELPHVLHKFVPSVVDPLVRRHPQSRCLVYSVLWFLHTVGVYWWLRELVDTVDHVLKLNHFSHYAVVKELPELVFLPICQSLRLRMEGCSLPTHPLPLDSVIGIEKCKRRYLFDCFRWYIDLAERPLIGPLVIAPLVLSVLSLFTCAVFLLPLFVVCGEDPDHWSEYCVKTTFFVVAFSIAILTGCGMTCCLMIGAWLSLRGARARRAVLADIEENPPSEEPRKDV